MKKRILCVLLSVLCLSLCVTAYAEEASPVAKEVVGANIITHVYEQGQYVAGIRVEYPTEIASGGVGLSTYNVTGYMNVSAYVNNDGVVGHAENAGRYAFIEFAEPQGNFVNDAKTLQYIDGSNCYRQMTLDVFQNATVTMMDDSVVNGCVFKAEGYIDAEVDKYLEKTYTNASGQTLNYRLYIPDGYAEKADALDALPLVIFLHGGGEGGNAEEYNNITQLTGNRSALDFTTPEAQAKNPCFLLAPQAPADVRWSDYAIDNTAAVVAELLENYNIDNTRIYGYGLSMGAGGTWTMMTSHPDMYAAALVIAGGGVGDREDEVIEAMKHIPVWFLAGYDDGTAGPALEESVGRFEAMGCAVSAFTGDKGFNGNLRGYASAMQALDQISDAERLGADKLITTFITGTIQPVPHYSWITITQNTAIRDWLFSHSNNGYSPK